MYGKLDNLNFLVDLRVHCTEPLNLMLDAEMFSHFYIFQKYAIKIKIKESRHGQLPIHAKPYCRYNFTNLKVFICNCSSATSGYSSPISLCFRFFPPP